MIGDLFIVDQDRDLFFAIEIAIGDRHLVKRSPDDRDREIQRSRSQKRDLFGDLLSNGDRDRDLKFDEDRDRDHDRNFRDRTNTLFRVR